MCVYHVLGLRLLIITLCTRLAMSSAISHSLMCHAHLCIRHDDFKAFDNYDTFTMVCDTCPVVYIYMGVNNFIVWSKSFEVQEMYLLCHVLLCNIRLTITLPSDYSPW